MTAIFSITDIDQIVPPSTKLRKRIDHLTFFERCCAVVLASFPRRRLTLTNIQEGMHLMGWQNLALKQKLIADALCELKKIGLVKSYSSATTPRWQFTKRI